MNTQLNIKTRFSPSFVTLLVGIVVALAMLALSGPSVQAQTTATTADVAAPVDSSITISTKGAVSDPNGSVTVSGDVIVTARRVIDTTSATAPPIVLLDFDFSQLKGTSGSLKTLRTYVTGDNHATEIRPLQSSDTIIVTTPYFDSSKGPLTARSMLVTASLNFDVATGKLASGSISVGNNVATSATVGTITATPQ